MIGWLLLEVVEVRVCLDEFSILCVDGQNVVLSLQMFRIKWSVCLYCGWVFWVCPYFSS